MGGRVRNTESDDRSGLRHDPAIDADVKTESATESETETGSELGHRTGFVEESYSSKALNLSCKNMGPDLGAGHAQRPARNQECSKARNPARPRVRAWTPPWAETRA